MKNIFILVLANLSILSCKAQTPILNITQDNGDQIPGAYYKDLDNLLNPFEGTYVYVNGNDSLKVVLQKKTMSQNYNYYEDILIGEYLYIKDGVEIINTLPKLNETFTNQELHNISGNMIITGIELCEECSPTEKHLHGGLTDQNSNNWASFQIRKITVNGQEAIKFYFYWHYQTHKVGDPEPAKPSFPSGDYTMIKQ